MDSPVIKAAALVHPRVNKRRRTAVTQTDLLRVIKAASSAGWTHVEIEQPCGTIIRLRPGSADPVSAPNGRGLDVVP
jgi:hypothetical protein